MCASKACSTLDHGPSSIEWNQAHQAIKADDEVWRFLRFEGLQPDGVGGLFEARTCPRCQSTILRPISGERALELYEQQRQIHAQALEVLSFSPRLYAQAIALFGGKAMQS